MQRKQLPVGGAALPAAAVAVLFAALSVGAASAAMATAGAASTPAPLPTPLLSVEFSPRARGRAESSRGGDGGAELTNLLATRSATAALGRAPPVPTAVRVAVLCAGHLRSAGSTAHSLGANLLAPLMTAGQIRAAEARQFERLGGANGGLSNSVGEAAAAVVMAGRGSGSPTDSKGRGSRGTSFSFRIMRRIMAGEVALATGASDNGRQSGERLDDTHARIEVDLHVVTHAALSSDKPEAARRAASEGGAFYGEGVDMPTVTADLARDAADFAVDLYRSIPGGPAALASVTVLNSTALSSAAAAAAAPYVHARRGSWRYGPKAAARVTEVALLARLAFERLRWYERSFFGAEQRYDYVLKIRPDIAVLRPVPSLTSLLPPLLPPSDPTLAGASKIAGPLVSSMSDYQRRLGFNFSDHLTFGSRSAVEAFSRFFDALPALDERGVDVSCIEDAWPAYLRTEAGLAFLPSLNISYKIDRALPAGGIAGARQAWVRQLRQQRDGE